MIPIYSTSLSPAQGWLFVFVLLALFFFFLVGVPAIKREIDKNGGGLLFQMRGVASFGGGGLRFGGAFYRFSVYENYLVVCFFFANSYEYQRVKIRVPYKNGSNELKLMLGHVPVTIYGDSENLGAFVKKMVERMSVVQESERSDF